MEKQLTKAEIQQIFDFTKSKGLSFYDIQIEVVDHFASTIEEKWSTYPIYWTFEQKIQDVYHELGDKGFENIVRGKSVAIMRRVNKLAFNYVKETFKIPKIILIILLICLLQQTFLISESPAKLCSYGLLGSGIILVIGTIFLCVLYLFTFKKKIHAFEQGIGAIGLTTSINGFIPFIAKSSFSYSTEIYFLLSTLMILYFIFCIGLLTVLWNIIIDSKNQYENTFNA